MIQAENLTKKFGKLTILRDLNVTLEAGRTVSLIGPNGSGKTTFIKCLLGMNRPDRGQILFNGQSITDAWEYRRHIGYMPQIGRYPDNMTVRQLFAMMKDLRRDQVHPLDEELFEEFGVPAFYDKPMRTLSGGMRQKVSAALAFLFNPQVLILDEPTAGLDPVASELLKAKIRREQTSDKLILITSHVLSDLDELTTHVMYLQEGTLQFMKPIETLKRDTGQDQLGRAIAHIMLNGTTDVIQSELKL